MGLADSTPRSVAKVVDYTGFDLTKMYFDGSVMRDGKFQKIDYYAPPIEVNYLKTARTD